MFIEDLITRYEAKEEFFTVKLPDGEELKFKFLTEYSEIKKLQEGAARFATKMIKGEGILPAWKEFITDDIDTLTTVYILAATIQEPKLTHIDLLKLAKKAGYIYSYIVNSYNFHETQHIIKKEVEEIEELKND